MSAEQTWWGAVIALFAIVAVVLLRDLCYWLLGKETVTGYLRSDMQAFFWPATAATLLLLALYLHLRFGPGR